MPLAPMTIAIASYQRRSSLLRLLRALDAQATAAPSLAEDLDVVVVLDGSTDGSKEAVEAATWTLPTTVLWQPNRGLAAARNAGLRAAGDRCVWFLDDDLIPGDNLLERHRRAHEEGTAAVVVGRCQIPPDADVDPSLRQWWDDFHDQLGASDAVERFDLFTAANTSGPARLFREVGGFDERFRAYGLEDFELGYRLLARGTETRYAPDALAWHPDVPRLSTLIGRQRGVGANAAKIVSLHPELLDELFPVHPRVSPARRLLRRLRVRQERSLAMVAKIALISRRALSPVHPGLARKAEKVARAAVHAAGVASEDPTGKLLDRVFGQPERRPSARASRSPDKTPSSNGPSISR